MSTKNPTYLNKAAGLFKYAWPLVDTRQWRVENCWFDKMQYEHWPRSSIYLLKGEKENCILL